MAELLHLGAIFSELDFNWKNFNALWDFLKASLDQAQIFMMHDIVESVDVNEIVEHDNIVEVVERVGVAKGAKKRFNNRLMSAT